MHFKKIEVNGERGAPFNGRPDCPVRFVKENEWAYLIWQMPFMWLPNLFDFGDDWWHELSILKIEDASGSKGYPKITKKIGESPDQYPDYEGDYDEDSGF